MYNFSFFKALSFALHYDKKCCCFFLDKAPRKRLLSEKCQKQRSLFIYNWHTMCEKTIMHPRAIKEKIGMQMKATGLGPEFNP